jgi:hypothetical protein
LNELRCRGRSRIRQFCAFHGKIFLQGNVLTPLSISRVMEAAVTVGASCLRQKCGYTDTLSSLAAQFVTKPSYFVKPLPRDIRSSWRERLLASGWCGHG